MDSSIGVDQDTLRGKPLGAVAGNGIAVIKVAMLFWIEFNLTIVFESASDAAIGINLFNYRVFSAGLRSYMNGLILGRGGATALGCEPAID